MNSISYSPYEQQPRESRRGPKLLLLVALLVTAGVLVGVVVLPAGEGHHEVTQPPAVRGVSGLVYPASLVQELGQPVNDQWLLPAAAVTVGGVTFVLDTGNDRILKLDRSGFIVATLDSASDERLVLRQPMAMASDGLRLFIANSLAAEVVVLDVSGRVEKVLPLQAGLAGAREPRPIGIAVAADGSVIVSDANNHRVLMLDSEGHLLWAVGTGGRGGGAEGFNVPGNLAVDNAGNIYVVDTLNGRVVELSSDGTYIRQFGQLGDTAGTLSRPKGVAVDSQGHVFVSDGLLAAIEVFAPDGTYLGVIGRRDPADPASGSLFQAPAGLWQVGERLYVTDRFAGLITLQLSGATLSKAATGEREGG